MALNLLERVKALLPKREETAGPASTTPAGASREERPAPAPPPTHKPTAWDAFLAGLPFGMFVSGAILAAFSQLIGAWAVLGYLLLTLSPVVYWLRRLERRLAELVQRDRR